MQRAIHRYTSVYSPSSYYVSIRNNHNNVPQDPIGTSASAKLFADAAREEAETPSRITLLETQHENWTGDESTQDAVLRMLVDKYKPLRSGSIWSAEQRLKQNPPRVWSSDQLSAGPSTGSWATQPLLPSSEDHRPWHTQFKAPSHATSSIKHANIPPASVRRPSITPIDDRAKRKQKEAKQKEERVGRLAQARESILDYRLGIKRAGDTMRRANPLTLKGWTGLIEDKIQVGRFTCLPLVGFHASQAARSKGLFNTVKGRGQPLARHVDESNPFIAREEFLMNRIVQRNGAAPPWVEVQGGRSNARAIKRYKFCPDPCHENSTPPSTPSVRSFANPGYDKPSVI
jgi:DnaJ homolog subfamily C member 28